MELSLSEVVILATLGNGNGATRDGLAKEAARAYPSTKFDTGVALSEIGTLITRRFIRQDKASLHLTYEGHAALLSSIPVVEGLRGLLAGAAYKQVVR